jgi:hypothetical protein
MPDPVCSMCFKVVTSQKKPGHRLPRDEDKLVPFASLRLPISFMPQPQRRGDCKDGTKKADYPDAFPIQSDFSFTIR